MLIMFDPDKKITDSYESIKSDYNKGKFLPGFKEKMAGIFERAAKESNQNENLDVISTNFEERDAVLITYVLLLNKKLNSFIYTVHFITKKNPTKVFNLLFFCARGYFNKYEPAFRKCLESFKIIE